ncbi:MAG: hypothetical protein GY838_06820 [bacterium]|nr:hypothetical protein [bacterium]
MITPALASAVQGMQMNQRAFARHAHRIANSGDPAAPTDPTADLVGVLVSQRGYEANVAVASKADEMLGTLIDMLA